MDTAAWLARIEYFRMTELLLNVLDGRYLPYINLSPEFFIPKVRHLSAVEIAWSTHPGNLNFLMQKPNKNTNVCTFTKWCFATSPSTLCNMGISDLIIFMTFHLLRPHKSNPSWFRVAFFWHRTPQKENCTVAWRYSSSFESCKQWMSM